MLAINTKGTFFCIQEAVARMVPLRRGRIVTIGSDSVTRGGGRVATAAYTASKGAVVALTRNIARDLLGTGVSVNCLNPGPIDSPMHAPLIGQRARVTASIPLGWMAKPEEIANGVLFLALGPRRQLHVRHQSEHRRRHPDGHELSPAQPPALCSRNPLMYRGPCHLLRHPSG